MQIRETLKLIVTFEIISEQDGALFSYLNETGTSFIYRQRQLIEPTVEYQGIKLAFPIDIGLMKLAAIASMVLVAIL
jgi:hypothetical protein